MNAYFIVGYFRKWDAKFGQISESFLWNPEDPYNSPEGWSPSLGKPYRSIEEAEPEAVFLAAKYFSKGDVGVSSFAQLERRWY
jgi:hypothetical protein